jgi:diguanylate cyclase (GGDEF)-like protein
MRRRIVLSGSWSRGRRVVRRLGVFSNPGNILTPPDIPPQVIARLQTLALDDLILHFQPILLLRDPGRIALELLVRFRSPELAAVETGTVVRWVNNLGLGHRLDRLVLQRLGEVHQAWRELGHLAQRIDYISVNIGAGSLATPERQQALISELRSQRVDPALFRLELAEMTAMDLVVPEVDTVRTVSQRLIEELNFKLLVDDFGSGLSNYRRLCEAWYDTIKLDVQLVRGIAGSLRLQTFVGSLIQAVHGFGRAVVAEGVELQDDLETLLQLGIDAVQGYLIAPALSWRDVEAFLVESPWLSSDPRELLAAGSRSGEDEPAAASSLGAGLSPLPVNVPMERYVLRHWSTLRSFEEVVLLYVNELCGWGLDVLRLSLAFLPTQEEVDCTQYIWYSQRPHEVESKRMQRDFLQTVQHRESVLHHIATRDPMYRLCFLDEVNSSFSFLEDLRQLGASDYLGLRLSSRGVSTPVLSICLRGEQRFAAEQVGKIENLSHLLSILFHAFECERASRLSLMDSLTLLPNRRSFDSRIRAEVVAAATVQAPISLILIDVDRFKLVNDRLGHAHGDNCLTQVATLLKGQLLRQGDMVARLGGEEFGVILAHTDHQAATMIAERLRQAVATARLRHPAPVNGDGLTISLGLASWAPQDGVELNLDRLLQTADDCLYAAKRAGRDRLVTATLVTPPDERGGTP